MKRFVKCTALLLALITLLLTGCGKAPGILDDGADRFAGGKAEDNYYLKNSGVLLDELIDQYSGSYQIPTSIQIDPDDVDPATQPTDPADPDATAPTDGDAGASIPQVGSWDDFLRVFLDAYTATSEQLTFELVNGFTLDMSKDLNQMHVDLQRQDPIHANSVKQWSTSYIGNIYTVKITYHIDVPTLKALKEETPALVEAAVAQIDTAGKSDYEIICAVNDYLCNTVYYPPTEPYAPVTHTAYGALHDGVAVCEGYACAAKLMLNALGIRCDIQVGTCLDGGGHAWNLVELDGQWYQMDVTWNDGGGRVTDYLLVDDAYMQKSRYWEYAQYPACTVMYVH